MIREFFYLQKSDRKVILTLLLVIVVALTVIFLTGGQNEVSNALTPADSSDSTGRRYADRDSFYRRPPYARTRVVYRDRHSGYDHDRYSSNYHGRYSSNYHDRYSSNYHDRYPSNYHDRSSGSDHDRYSSNYPDRPSSSYRQRTATEPRDTFIPRYPVKIRETEHMVLNTADTAALQRVPGIGPYFARQILRYGERLGGYVSVDQLDEIDDFPTESKHFFVIENPSPRKLNINQLSLYELRRHPYINYYQARAITDYRRLHGPIRSLDDLRLSKDFPQEAIDRLSPYVAY